MAIPNIQLPPDRQFVFEELLSAKGAFPKWTPQLKALVPVGTPFSGRFVQPIENQEGIVNHKFLQKIPAHLNRAFLQDTKKVVACSLQHSSTPQMRKIHSLFVSVPGAIEWKLTHGVTFILQVPSDSTIDQIGVIWEKLSEQKSQSGRWKKTYLSNVYHIIFSSDGSIKYQAAVIQKPNLSIEEKKRIGEMQEKISALRTYCEEHIFSKLDDRSQRDPKGHEYDRTLEVLRRMRLQLSTSILSEIENIDHLRKIKPSFFLPQFLAYDHVSRKTPGRLPQMKLLLTAPLAYSDLIGFHHEKFNLETLPRFIENIFNDLIRLHSAGWVHTDVKPDNILVFVEEDDSLIARLSDWDALSKSGDRRKSWTVEYLSPVAAKTLAKKAFFSDDIYALATVALLLLYVLNSSNKSYLEQASGKLLDPQIPGKFTTIEKALDYWNQFHLFDTPFGALCKQMLIDGNRPEMTLEEEKELLGRLRSFI